MNAKPTLETIKNRNSQLSLVDLHDTFKCNERRWLVYRNSKGEIRAVADTKGFRISLNHGHRDVHRLSGCSRVHALRIAKKLRTLV